MDNITFTNLQALTNQVVASVASGTNFVFTPPQAGNYLLQAEAIAYGPVYMGYGPPIFFTAGAVANPILAGNVQAGKLSLSWSDPSFTLQKSTNLASAAWVSLAGSNSPVVITIGALGNAYYRLMK